MEKVTAELRDSLIAGFSREALHLEMRDLYAAADHGRFRAWLADPSPDLERCPCNWAPELGTHYRTRLAYGQGKP